MDKGCRIEFTFSFRPCSADMKFSSFDFFYSCCWCFATDIRNGEMACYDHRIRVVYGRVFFSQIFTISLGFENGIRWMVKNELNFVNVDNIFRFVLFSSLSMTYSNFSY